MKHLILFEDFPRAFDDSESGGLGITYKVSMTEPEDMSMASPDDTRDDRTVKAEFSVGDVVTAQLVGSKTTVSGRVHRVDGHRVFLRTDGGRTEEVKRRSVILKDTPAKTVDARQKRWISMDGYDAEV